MLPSERVREVLLAAATGGQAVKDLYEAAKEAKGSRISLTFLCRRAGISSKGYLSDVMHGRRTLNRAYWEPLCESFNIYGLNRRYLNGLFKLEQSESANEKKAAEAELETLRKSFAIVKSTDPSPLQGSPFAFEVFCAFGLFRGRPQREDLVFYFGDQRTEEVDGALTALKDCELIKEIVPHRYELTSQQIYFTSDPDEEGHLSHLEFLRDAILQAADQSEKWYEQRAQAHLESSILSVRKESYLRLLGSLKDDLLKWQSKLEDTDADMLIRFNVQIYPVSEKQAPTKIL